jgi:UDP-3-O-[3-hydroxymyristoyl] glucosamine N-acyltransferase
MKRTAREIATAIGGELHGDGETVLQSVASLKNAEPADLTYAEDKFHDQVRATRAGCVIIASGNFPGLTVITVAHPKLAFARAAALLLADEGRKAGIHPSAVIAADVTVGMNVRIGACAVVEAGAAIGDNSTLEAGGFVGRGSRIGASCTIYPRVVIYHDVTIGNRVIVHAGAVIGADGFGFVRHGSEYVKFPQAGRVLIEDDVEIGANTCIDRGSLETTVVRRGVKLDNLVQVAHNVEVGEHTVIAAQTGISGSCTIGADSMIGGQVGMGEQANLERGTIIGGQAGVLKGKRVKGGEVLFGTPVRPLKQFLEEQALLSRLPRLVEEVRRLREEWTEFRRRFSDGK